MTPSITTFSINTLSVLGFYVKLTINNTQRTQHLAYTTLRVTTLCQYAECRDAVYNITIKLCLSSLLQLTAIKVAVF